MTPIFVEKDNLLLAQANLPIYVLAYRELKSRGQTDLFTRTSLISFNDQRTKNRALAESDIAAAQFELLEYDRLSQQGTSDASSIRERLKILVEWLSNKK